MISPMRLGEVGCLFFNVVQLPPLTSVMLAEVVKRKKATAG